MRLLLRGILTAVLCAAAIFAGDTLFRSSLLDNVRPIVLTPLERSVVRPPVRLAWEGRERMEVFLAPFGEPARSLGVHSSPIDIPRDQFPREGGYEIEIRDPDWGDWIGARRKFQMHLHRPTGTDDAVAAPEDTDDSHYLMLAFDAARQARDKARARIKALRKDNADLRAETERLAARLDQSYNSQDDDTAQITSLERDLIDAVGEIRGLREALAAERFRMSTVIPCTVWGYYSFPRPQTIPRTRRMVRVSDDRSNIFRSAEFCEEIRRADPASDSPCFCVGDSFAR